MNKVVVFDLDDTLYKEVDYLKSAFSEIASIISEDIEMHPDVILSDMMQLYHNKENVFSRILNKYQSLKYTITDLIETYRNHKPKISLSSDIKQTLNKLQLYDINFGIITDGRSLQQRNKIEALGLDNYIEHIIISEEFGFEKPHIANYTYFQNIFPHMEYYYIGDNINKDFITPNQLGWKTICITDDGRNIHSQNIRVNSLYKPKHFINNFSELPQIII